MASTLTVPVVQAENVRPHPNADRLELCDVLGYQMAVPRGRYGEGDVGVYFPADTLLPDEWATKFGVKEFLKGKSKDRVGRIRLRGEPSFGLFVPVLEDQDWKVGDNVAEFFGCRKYEPPVKTSTGDAAPHDERIDPFVERYTDVENGRIFVDVFSEGEEIVVTEKVHGSNCKVGLVKDVGVFASSMGVRRKRPVDDEGNPVSYDDERLKRNVYWFPWTVPGVEGLFHELVMKNDVRVVTLYGEVYGGSVQSMDYGVPKGHGLGFVAFDIMVNGSYLDWDEFYVACEKHGVPRVPLLYRGPYATKKVKELADGNSTLSGAEHIREGVVVRPIKERTNPKVGRAVLKFIGTEYELSKHKEKDTTDV